MKLFEKIFKKKESKEKPMNLWNEYVDSNKYQVKAIIFTIYNYIIEFHNLNNDFLIIF
jgi:hypothetical protein